MHAVTVGRRVVGTFKRADDAHDWAGMNLAVGFRVEPVDMRIRLARALVVNSRPRVRPVSFDLDIGVYY